MSNVNVKPVSYYGNEHFQLTSVEYRKGQVKVNGLSKFAKSHNGAAYLLCDFNPSTEEMTAKRWSHVFPHPTREEIVVVFCERQ